MRLPTAEADTDPMAMLGAFKLLVGSPGGPSAIAPEVETYIRAEAERRKAIDAALLAARR